MSPELKTLLADPSAYQALAGMALVPLFLVFSKRQSIRARHGHHLLVGSVVAAVAAVMIYPQLQSLRGSPSAGAAAFGLLVGGVFALAYMLFVGSIAAYITVALRGDPSAPGASAPRRGRRPTQPSDLKRYRHWQNAVGEPGATYEDYARRAPPRYFIASWRTIVGVALVIGLLYFGSGRWW